MKQIKDHPDYFASKDGYIISLKNKSKTLKGRLTEKGYLSVVLYNNGISKSFRVHRLIAQTFLKNPQNKPFVNHKNGNKLDNSIKNLEWCTHQENIIHAFENNLIDRNKLGITYLKEIAKIDIQTNKIIQIYKGVNEASKQNNNLRNISQAARNINRSQAGGFKWAYITQ